MKKVLLISNYVFHYRLNIYNYFFVEFKKIGYEFTVLANNAQDVDFEINYPLIIKKPLPWVYLWTIKSIQPDVIITFLHLKDSIIYFINYYCKLRGLPLIYWNFGINTATPNSLFKNLIYYHIHSISDAIILYTPNEKKYIKAHNLSKTFIANNTLNFQGIDRDRVGPKNYIQKKYKIKEDFVVLFSGRITANKRLHLLLEIFRNNKEIAIVIIGKGITPEQERIIDKTENYYYLGEIYNKSEMSKIFNSVDVFCIPGNLGLALNEAFFWGKPVLTVKNESTINTPEIWYFEDKKNGLMAKDVNELEHNILILKNNKTFYKKLSDNAKKTADNKGHISKMFKGFKEAVKFVEKKNINNLE